MWNGWPVKPPDLSGCTEADWVRTIVRREVKFYDPHKCNRSEGASVSPHPPGCGRLVSPPFGSVLRQGRRPVPGLSRRSRAKAWISKTIRYRCSPCRKLMPFLISVGKLSYAPAGSGNLQLALGGVWSQDWNLKVLTEEHHQEWSLRLNLNQHGESYEGMKYGMAGQSEGLSRIPTMGGAWPFLVRGAICQLNCGNERDPRP